MLTASLALLLSCQPSADKDGPAQDSASILDTADSGDSTDSADSADTAETADSGDSADSSEVADSGDTTDTSDTADSADTADSGSEVAEDAPADFALADLNTSSARYGVVISPRDYLEEVSGWYFIHAT